MTLMIPIVIVASILYFILSKLINRLGAGFYMADTFLLNLASYRTLWLNGRFGGGKTSLSVWLGAWLYSSGRVHHIHANFPTAIACDPHKGCFDACIIMDEAHLYLEEWRVIQRHMAFLRKRNQVLIMPSVFPPSARLRLLTCQRIFNLMLLGIDAWAYQWTLNAGNITEKGYFIIMHPKKVYPYYDTEQEPDDDGGIFDAIRAYDDAPELDDEDKDAVADIVDDKITQAIAEGKAIPPESIEVVYKREIERMKERKAERDKVTQSETETDNGSDNGSDNTTVTEPANTSASKNGNVSVSAQNETTKESKRQNANKDSAIANEANTMDDAATRLEDAAERLSTAAERTIEGLSRLRKR